MKTAATHYAGEAEGHTTKSFTRHFPTVARILMGLPLVVFGLNGFAFHSATHDTHARGCRCVCCHMMQLIGATHMIVGVLLVLNRFVPLALALFAPFIVNSIAFHLVLAPSGLPMAAVFLALELYLAWAYRRAYRPMLAVRSSTAMPWNSLTH